MLQSGQHPLCLCAASTSSSVAHQRTWNRETLSSLVPLGNWALSTQCPRLLCQTRRRPLCLLR